MLLFLLIKLLPLVALLCIPPALCAEQDDLSTSSADEAQPSPPGASDSTCELYVDSRKQEAWEFERSSFDEIWQSVKFKLDLDTSWAPLCTSSIFHAIKLACRPNYLGIVGPLRSLDGRCHVFMELTPLSERWSPLLAPWSLDTEPFACVSRTVKEIADCGGVDVRPGCVSLSSWGLGL